MRVATTDNLERDVDDGSDPNGRILALELDIQQRLRADGLPLEFGRSKALAIPSSDLAENPHRRMRVLVVERQRAKEFPETDHDLVDNGRHERVEELLREVVDAELEGAKSLADEVGAGLEGVDKRSHEVGEVGEEDREANGDGEDELGEEVAARLVRGLEESIELLEEDLEEGEDLVVEDLEAAAADGAEECAEEEVVGVGFRRLRSELERAHDEVREVGEEHRLVLLGEDGDGHERHLVEAEHDRGVLLVVLAVLAEFAESGGEEAEEDGDKVLRDVFVGEEGLRDDEEFVVLRWSRVSYSSRRL